MHVRKWRNEAQNYAVTLTEPELLNIFNTYMNIIVRIIATCVVLNCSLTGVGQTWEKTYGGNGSEQFFSIAVSSDSGFYGFGSSGSLVSGGGDMYLVRGDKNGLRLWSKGYGGAQIDYGCSVKEIPNGIMLAGTSLNALSGYDMNLIITDDAGAVQLDKKYGSTDWEFANDAIPLADGFVIVGQSYALGAGNAWVIRTDLSGNQIWDFDYGNNFIDAAHGVVQTTDGGFAVCGKLNTVDGSTDLFVFKLNASGVLEWDATIASDSSEVAYDIIEAQNGDLVVCGASNEFQEFDQVILARYSSTGSFIWEQFVGTVDDLVCRSILEDANGDLVGFGDSKGFGLGAGDYFLLRTSNTGNFISGLTYGGTEVEQGYSHCRTLDRGFLLAGLSKSYGPGPEAAYVLKTDSLGQTAALAVDTVFDPLSIAGRPLSADGFSLAPSVAISGDVIRIQGSIDMIDKIELVDVLGRVKDLQLNDNVFDTTGLSAGRYSIRFVSFNAVFSLGFVIGE